MILSDGAGNELTKNIYKMIERNRTGKSKKILVEIKYYINEYYFFLFIFLKDNWCNTKVSV